MDSGSTGASRLSPGIRSLVPLVDALALVVVAAIVTQAIGQPGSLLASLLNGGYATQGVYALWCCLAIGAGAVVRGLLGVDPFIQRDPESGFPRLSLRRAARELPGFWFFLVAFLLGGWGYGAFSLAVTMTGSPGSVPSVACAVLMLSGLAAIFVWMTWIVLARSQGR